VVGRISRVVKGNQENPARPQHPGKLIQGHGNIFGRFEVIQSGRRDDHVYAGRRERQATRVAHNRTKCWKIAPSRFLDRSMAQVHADSEPHILKKIVEDAIDAVGFLEQVGLQHNLSRSMTGRSADPFLVHATLLLRHQGI